MKLSTEIKPKVFISGPARSGTSILLFAVKAAFALPGYGESHVLAAIDEMLTGYNKYREQLNALQPSDRQNVMLSRISLAEIKEPLFHRVRQLYSENFPAGVWVDKTPSARGIYALKIADESFPDAILIATKRTGIEVIASYMRKFHVGLETSCDRWLDAMTALESLNSLSRNVLIVDQFDFHNNTEAVATSIASHIGLPDKCSELAHLLVTRRAEGSSTHDWRRRLELRDVGWSDREKSVFREKCTKMMEVHNYPI